MSKLLQEIFGLIMNSLPYVPDPELDRAAEALEQRLGREGEPLLRAYQDASGDHIWREEQQVFRLSLVLGIELGRLEVS